MNVIRVSSYESVGSFSSVGSITSKLAETKLDAEPSPSIEEVKQQLEDWKTTCDRLSRDAGRWNYAKSQLYKQLGYTSPIAMQADVDEKMKGRE